jgi:signal transduction histidine kinase
MEIAPEAVEPAAPKRRRFGLTTENPLVGAVGRVPLPLGAKLIAGFAVVAALLVVGYALGIVALSQSNSRGKRLQTLQAREAYVQQLKADANLLQNLMSRRLDFAGGLYCGIAGDCRASYGRHQNRAVLLELDNAVNSTANQLVADFPQPGLTGSTPPLPSVHVRRLHDQVTRFQAVFAKVNFSDTSGQGVVLRYVVKGEKLASSVFTDLSSVAGSTTVEAQKLVAENQGSFIASRNLLLGVAGGSLLLALALGLLLSWSVVAPLRRTQRRLSEIATGTFAGHVTVPNRDEIGVLATAVNQMSDELGRLYRELESASRHKSDFLATMSHELRTPLNAIIGFSEVLHEQMFGELNERQLAYVNDVLEAGRHLLSLINDVLDLAKIEAGKLELDLSRVDLPGVLRSAIAIHAERASRAGVELALTAEPEVIPVTADERRLRQVVFNLVSNAVKFTPANGRVDISARFDEGGVEVTVADTGPGIAPDDLDRIFEEFEQTAEGKQAEGTGLGLPLSRKLVELHGGRLWAESEPGHGSTFRFTLPTAEDPT